MINKLVQKGGVLPPHLIVNGACRIGDDPIAGGGFADIWKGKIEAMPGTFVALKVLRIFGRPEDRKTAFSVGEVSQAVTPALMTSLSGILQRGYGVATIQT